MWRTTLGGALVVAVLLTACTRPENASSGDESIPTVPTSTVDTSTVPSSSAPTDPTQPSGPSTSTSTSTSTAAGSSTVPPSSAPPSSPPNSATPTTEPPPTAPAPPALDDLTLIFDGVVPFRFGDRDVDVVPALADDLGPPVSDDLSEYPTADAGVFLDETGEQAFIAPFGRMVCFANSLCLQFGAGAPETLLFTGWRIDDSAPSDLTTQDGIAIGSTLADHADVITFDPAVSCFQVAYGAAEGIDVTLLSDDGVFSAPSADGDGVDLGDPDPALVYVQAMSAGELPVFLFADC